MQLFLVSCCTENPQMQNEVMEGRKEGGKERVNRGGRSWRRSGLSNYKAMYFLLVKVRSHFSLLPAPNNWFCSPVGSHFQSSWVTSRWEHCGGFVTGTSPHSPTGFLRFAWATFWSAQINRTELEQKPQKKHQATQSGQLLVQTKVYWFLSSLNVETALTGKW